MKETFTQQVFQHCWYSSNLRTLRTDFDHDCNTAVLHEAKLHKQIFMTRTLQSELKIGAEAVLVVMYGQPAVCPKSRYIYIYPLLQPLCNPCATLVQPFKLQTLSPRQSIVDTASHDSVINSDRIRGNWRQQDLLPLGLK